ncbi:hypothetical protein SO802_022928 [Lithocarpus litseifolius]|uniref:Uncharacterized protein n=1 Tax=Lithocarpus litseifolius TaxID=425828 RepID=A0AAW2CAA8_9ROSI
MMNTPMGGPRIGVALLISVQDQALDMTSMNLEDEGERLEGNESEYFPQYICLSNKGKKNLFEEWMDNIEHLDAYASDKCIDMEIDGESIDYMDKDPVVLMLREERTNWEPATIIEAATELKN